MKGYKYRSILEYTASTGELSVKNTIRIDNAGRGMKIPNQESYEVMREQYAATMGSKINFAGTLQDGSAEENTPKDEDFVRVPFRLLSAAIVGAGTWRATDFRNEKVLKASRKLLDRQPVYKNHSTYTIDNAIGIITKPVWQDSYQDDKGNTIPAGINGVVNIDMKIAPKIARNVVTGAIHSESVSVMFDWKPSHEFEDEWGFYDNLGKVVDKKMVTRQVTKIHDYFESSLVFLGADPYAKKLDEDGKIINPDSTAIYDDDNVFSKESYTKKESWNASCSVDGKVCVFNDELKFFKSFSKPKSMDPKVMVALVALLGLAENTQITEEHIAKLKLSDTSEEEGGGSKELLEKVAEFAKVALGDENTSDNEAIEIMLNKGKIITEEQETTAKKDLEAFTKELEDLKARAEKSTEDFATLEAENAELKESFGKSEKTVETLTSDKVALDAKIAELEPEAEVGRNYTDKKNEEVISGLMGKANSEELNGLLKQYVSKATERFGGKCSSCDSTEFVFQSSVVEEVETHSDKINTFAAFRERFVED